MGFHLLYEHIYNSSARGVLVMNYPVARVACFKSHLKTSSFVKVERNTHLLEPEYVVRSFRHEYLNSLKVVLIFSCDKGIGNVELEVVVALVEHCGYAALCKR